MNLQNELFLAALLSDIGLVNEYSDGQTPHWKASLDFLNVFEDKLAKLGLDLSVIKHLIENHHKQEEHLSKILFHANALTLGGYDEDVNSDDWKSAAPPAFTSIFSKVKPTSRNPEPAYLTPKVLSIKELQFPEKQVLTSLEVYYENLWKGLLSEAQKLPAGSISAFQTSLIALLKKYLNSVPATKTIGFADLWSQDDVSLFQRMRLTAALARCMASLSENELDGLRGKSSDEPVAQLISGDLSGIQNFLYLITSSGVAKGVRGRSLYLQLLNESIAHFVLSSLNLPSVNLLYSSGGNFYILAHPQAAAEIEHIQSQINKIILQHHRGDIYCALAPVPLMLNDFLDGIPLAKKWSHLTQSLSEKKRQKFLDLAVSNYDQIFELTDSPIEDLCTICMQEKITDREKNIGKFCKSFEEVGDQLGKADYLVIANPGASTVVQTGTYEEILCEFGRIYKLTEFSKVNDLVRTLSSYGAENIQVLRLNNTSFLDNLSLPDTVGRGWYLIGNVTPWRMKNEERVIADFSDLADKSNGVNRWGTLRMDVDNLGDLFKEGFIFEDNEKSLSDDKDEEPLDVSRFNISSLARIVTLSDQISLFFEGYLNEIVGKYNEFDLNNSEGSKKSDYLYILYSGGDDLFIVGSWDVLIKVAYDIRNQFKKYVCQNPKVTLSGGIALHKKKYPLYKAAEVAKDALETAKESISPGGVEKDAFGFFGRGLHWEEEFEIVKKLFDQITLLVDKGIEVDGKKKNLSMGFLNRLAEIYGLYLESKEIFESANDAIEGEQFQTRIQNYRWRWRAAYTFAREDKDFKNQLDGLSKELFTDNWIEYLGIAVRWVELFLREESEGGNV